MSLDPFADLVPQKRTPITQAGLDARQAHVNRALKRLSETDRRIAAGQRLKPGELDAYKRLRESTIAETVQIAADRRRFAPVRHRDDPGNPNNRMRPEASPQARAVEPPPLIGRRKASGQVSPNFKRLLDTPGTDVRNIAMLDARYGNDPKYLEARKEIWYRIRDARLAAGKTPGRMVLRTEAEDIANGYLGRRQRFTHLRRPKVEEPITGPTTPEPGETIYDAWMRFQEEDRRSTEHRTSPWQRLVQLGRTINTPDYSEDMEKFAESHLQGSGTAARRAGKFLNGLMDSFNPGQAVAGIEDSLQLANMIRTDPAKAWETIKAMPGDTPEEQWDFAMQFMGGAAASLITKKLPNLKLPGNLRMVPDAPDMGPGARNIDFPSTHGGSDTPNVSVSDGSVPHEKVIVPTTEEFLGAHKPDASISRVDSESSPSKSPKKGRRRGADRHRAQVESRTSPHTFHREKVEGETEAQRVIRVHGNNGAFGDDALADAAEGLWNRRASTYEKEKKSQRWRTKPNFWEFLKLDWDRGMPNGAVRRANFEEFVDEASVGDRVTRISEDPAMADHFRDNDSMIVALEPGDRTVVGRFLLPSGAESKGYGGPFGDISGVDPTKETLGVAWRNSVANAASRILNRSKNKGAHLQFITANAIDNSLASHGNLIIRDELDFARGRIEEEKILAHLRKVAEGYNKSLSTAKVAQAKAEARHLAGGPKPRPNGLMKLDPMKMPATIDEFLDEMEKVSSFDGRFLLAKKFWYGTTGDKGKGLFKTNFKDVALAAVEPGTQHRPNGGILNAIYVDPKGSVRLDGKHPIYPHAVEGRNLGLTRESDLLAIAPDGMLEAVEKHLASQGRGTSKELVRHEALKWLATKKDPTGQFIKNGTFKVSKEKLYKAFGEGVGEAWNDAERSTVRSLTTTTDFPRFTRDTFVDWSRTMSDDHIKIMEHHFGPVGSIDFDEQGSRAFARYLRNGEAPHNDLIPIFETIKKEMIRIYSDLQNSPLRDEIHPDVRRVFDEMLVGKSKNSSLRG